MRKYLLGVILFSSVFAACNPDKGLVKAIVRDKGDIAAGGCGYILELEDKTELMPTYLPSAYQSEGMRVKVKYNTNGEQQVCIIAPNHDVFQVVEIAKIKRDLD